MIDYVDGMCLCPTPNGHHIPQRVQRDGYAGLMPWTFCAECGWGLWGLYLIREEPW